MLPDDHYLTLRYNEILSQRLLELQNLAKLLTRQLKHEKDTVYILRQTQEEQLASNVLKAELKLIERLWDFISSLQVYPSKERLLRWSANLLSDLQVTEIKPQAGTNFDNQKHEVLTFLEKNDEDVLKVTSTLKTGYSYKGKVVKRAIVELKVTS